MKGIVYDISPFNSEWHLKISFSRRNRLFYYSNEGSFFVIQLSYWAQIEIILLEKKAKRTNIESFLARNCNKLS